MSAAVAAPRLTEQQLGVLSSSMSDGSCAMTLGRSVGWVVRMRLGMKPASVATPTPAPSSSPAAALARREIVSRPNGVKGMGSAPTPDQLDAAIAAAAGVRGLARDLAFHPTTEARRVRILAGAALRARLQTANTVLGPALQLHPQELSPSMVVKAGVTTDEMLTVVEAVAAVPVEVVAADAAAVQVAAPVDVAPAIAQAPAVVPMPPIEAKVARPTPVKPSPPRKIHDALPDRPLPAPRFPSQQRPRPSAPRAVVVQLKPVSPDIARWSRWFDRAGWPIDQVADLFGVDADALCEAVGA